VLELGLREALQLGHNYFGAEHTSLAPEPDPGQPAGPRRYVPTETAIIASRG